MQSTDFFNKLISNCKHVPESKLDKIISYYNNEISIGICNGKTEDEIILNFGDLDTIIYQINNDADMFIKNNLKTPSEKIIIQDETKEIKKSYYNNIKENKENSSKLINSLLKVIIAVLTITIIIPLATTIIGFILGILAVFLAATIFSLYLLFNIYNLNSLPRIPKFLIDFPHIPLVLFCISIICISACFSICIYYAAKYIISYFLKVYKLDRKNKGGHLIEK